MNRKRFAMVLKESFITLHHLRFHAFHGVLAQERVVGNDYVLSLRLGFDVSRAIYSDCVEDTLDYARVYQVVAQEMEKPAALLERLAGRIGERLFREFPDITSAQVHLVKCNPPMGADSEGAGVELHLINNKT